MSRSVSSKVAAAPAAVHSRPTTHSSTTSKLSASTMSTRASQGHTHYLNIVGLPLELWQVILSYLTVFDLARCSQVCHVWHHLVTSLDNTSWKRNFLSSCQWKHPAWPLGDWDDTWTWQSLYRQNHIKSLLWNKAKQHLNGDETNCASLLRRKLREPRIITVGPCAQYKTLKSALAVAGEYDRICVSPGTYDEQFEMSSKIPFELVGTGELGTVVVVMCVEQNATTGRLCNLVIKPPWFTTHVIKIMSGHLQVDNCKLEEGHIIVQSPGTCHFNCCSFNNIQLSLYQTCSSLIERCDFMNCTTTAVCVDGFPTEEKNWAFEHISGLCALEQLSTTDSQAASSVGSQSLSQSLSQCDHQAQSDTASKCQSAARTPPHQEEDADSIGVASIAGSHISDDPSLAASFESNSLSSETSSTHSRGQHSKPEAYYSEKADLCQAKAKLVLPSLDLSDSDSETSEDTTFLQLSASCGQMSSLWGDGEDTYMEASLREALQQPLCKDPQLVAMVMETQGPVIRQCKFSHCHGGVTVSRQGQLRIEKCEFRDLQYAVRCLQNAKVAILDNTIHHCSTSGIFMRLAANGLISGNDIYCTSEAGIDVRKGADPLIQCNKIHHSKRSGIVVLGSGRGIIKSNDIYQNREAGIYILYRGNPYISGNRIVHGGAAGIAVSEKGKGYIIENLISHNRWGGIDIRHGADPCVTHNLICNGVADGVVIGQKGKGTIQGNTIKGNAGCGLWVMGGQPLIQINQIYNNNDTGVSFVQNKATDVDYSGDEAEDSLSEESVDIDQYLEDSDYLRAGPTDTDQEDHSVSTDVLNPTLLYNTIYHNKGYGVLTQCSECLVLRGNAIHSNRNTGVYIRQSSLVSVISNSITSNTGIGLQVATQAKSQIEGNGIYDNKEHGVVISGEANLLDNDIFSNHMTAITLQDAAHCTLSGNRIFSPKCTGINVTSTDVKSHVHDNSLYPGEGQVVAVTEGALCEIKQNHINKKDEGNESGNRPNSEWHLEDPPPRPHIQAPPPIVPRSPIRRVTTVTRVMVPASGTCQQGSKLCIIV